MGNLEMFQELLKRCKQSSLSSNLKEVIVALEKEIIVRLEGIADLSAYTFVLNLVSAEMEDANGNIEKEELIDLQASLLKQRYFGRHG